MSAVDRNALLAAARNAVARRHHELFRAAQRAIGVEPVEYDALSERTRRLQHNQLDPLADVAVAAVLPLIADAIRAQRTAHLPDGPDHCERAANDAYSDAARLVRSLMAGDKTDD